MAKRVKQKDPEALDKQAEVVIAENDYHEFVADLVSAVDAADASRSTWKEKLARWYKKRYSIRPPKTFPWPGCSNLNVPLVDKTIRKMKPSFVGIAIGQEHTCYFNPVGDEDTPKAQKVEQFFDWLLLSVMKVFLPLVLITDRMLEQGYCIVKVIWDYKTRARTKFLDLDETPIETETDDQIIQHLLDTYKLTSDDAVIIGKVIEKIRKGERRIPIPVQEEEYNAPRWVVKEAKDVIVPPGTKDLQSALWVCDRLFLFSKDLKAESGPGRKYDENVVAEILALQKDAGATDSTKDTTSLELEKEKRSGVYDDVLKVGKPIEIWEIFCYYDINDDGVEEKCVLDICPSYKQDPLRFIEFPYDHGKWPLVKVQLEYNDDDFYASRGVPEILDHMGTELTVQHNQRLDRQTLANSFMYKYRPGVVNPDNIKFIPGQGIPVTDMEAIQPFIVPDVEVNSEREEMVLKAWAEEYIGSPDFGVGSLQNGNAPRTKYEIQSINAKSQQVFFSLDGLIFKEGLREVYEQTWALWVQYGPDEVWARVVGGDPWLAVKQDLDGNYDLQPGGKMGMYNPVLEAQQALADLQLFKGDPYIDQKQLRLNYLRSRDERLARKLMLSDQMIQVGLAERAKMAAAAGFKGAPGQQIQQVTGGEGGGAV